MDRWGGGRGVGRDLMGCEMSWDEVGWGKMRWDVVVCWKVSVVGSVGLGGPAG